MFDRHLRITAVILSLILLSGAFPSGALARSGGAQALTGADSPILIYDEEEAGGTEEIPEEEPPAVSGDGEESVFPDSQEEDGLTETEEVEEPVVLPVYAMPVLGAAQPQPRTVRVDYRLVNATAYNYPWDLTRAAGIPTVDAVTVTLLEDGEPINRDGIEASRTFSRSSSSNSREDLFTANWELPQEDENGDPIEYGELDIAVSPSLEDGSLSKRYTQTYTKYSNNNGRDLSWRYVTTLYGIDNVYVNVRWNGDNGDQDPYKVRPADIKYVLYADGEPVRSGNVVTRSQTQTVWRAERNGTIGGTALPQLSENGELIHYTVGLEDLPAYYTYELEQFPFVEGTGHLNGRGAAIYSGVYPGQIYSSLDLEMKSTKVKADFLFEGDGIGTDAEIKNRPTSLNVHLEYSADGGNTWQPFWGKYAYDVTEPGDKPNSFSYTWENLPAVDSSGAPVRYRVVQESLSLYSTGYDEPKIAQDGSLTELTVHNSYNDNWNYKIDLRWREIDPARKYDIRDVTVGTEKKTLVYELVVSVQKGYKAGDMEIRIPYELTDTRQTDRGIVPSAFSLGNSSNPSPDFCYTYRIDDGGTPGDTGDDTVIFYNYRDLESNDNVIISVQYDFTPQNVFDCSEQTFTAVGTGTYTDDLGNRIGPETIVSNSIHYRIDTGQSDITVRKSSSDPNDKSYGNVYFWNSSWGEEPEDFDMDSYNYVLYGLNAGLAHANQPMYFVITDKPGEEGEVYRVYDMSNRPVDFEQTGDGYVWRTGDINYNTRACNYKVLVRYPRTLHPDPLDQGQMTYEIDYTNHAEITSYASDEHEGDKEPDDLNDINTGSADAQDHWTDYEFIYTGEIYSTRKGMGYPQSYIDPIIYNYDMRETISWLEMTVNGYNLTNGYRLDLSDDAIYARGIIDGVYTPYVRLTPEDYQLDGPVSVTVYCTEVDRRNGQQNIGTMPEEGVSFWGRRSFDGPWQEIPVESSSVSESGKYYYYKLTDFTDKGYAQFRVSLPEGMKDYCRVVVNNLGVRIKGTSPTVHEWLKQGENVTVHAENFAAFELYTSDENGEYHWVNPYETTSNILADSVGLDALDKAEMGSFRERKNSGWDLKKAEKNTVSTKVTWREYPNPTDQTYGIQYRLSCVDEYYITNLPDEVFEAWSHESGVFFDLLPEGFILDTSKEIKVYGAHRISTGSNRGAIEDLNVSNGTRGSAKAVLESYEVIDNFRGTGRQLIIFRVRSNMAEGENYAKNYQHTFTGFCVDFYVVGGYNAIPTGDLYNLAAYQRTDGGNIEVGYNDDEYHTKQYTARPPVPTDENGTDVFYDINGDGFTDKQDTAFMASRVVPNFLRTIENGLSKQVRASGSVFSDTDVADLDGEYTYRIKLTASQGGTTKDVVFYDILENAANTEGHSGESSWKGSFLRTDVSAARARGLDIKVWYSTRPDLSYNDTDEAGNWKYHIDSAEEGVWTDVCPQDPSEVTAVAFDLRKCTDGSEKEFSEHEVVYVDIIMKAPSELTDAVYAFNRPGFNSTFIPKGSYSGSTSFNIADRVQVSLRDLQDIVIRKTGPSFEEEGGSVVLGGAVFNLYKCTDDSEGHLHSGSAGGSSSCWKLYSTRATTGDGLALFEDLDTGSYRLQESAPPSGYQSLGNNYWWVFEVDAEHRPRGTVSEPIAYASSGRTPVELVKDESAQANVYTLNDEAETVPLRVYKYWSSDTTVKDLPKHIQINIYRQKGAKGEKELYQSLVLNVTGTSYITRTLIVQKYYENATPYIYSVEEVPVEGFTTTVVEQSGYSDYRFRVTNTLETEETSVRKVWQNLDGSTDAPEGAAVTLRLYADGQKTDYAVVLDGNADETAPSKGGYEKEPWNAVFVHLPSCKYTENPETGAYEAKKIEYTVKEEEGITGYELSAEEASDGGTITNIQTETELTVSKHWQNTDGGNDAPQGARVTFTLLSDGTVTAYKADLDGTADDARPSSGGGYESAGWEATFIHLPEYRYEDGKAVRIVYSIKETDSTGGYAAEGDGTAVPGGYITNVQLETEISVTKVWKNAYGLKVTPKGASATFTLYADGEPTEYSVVLDGDISEEEEPCKTGGYERDEWNACFVHLPAYRYDGGVPVKIEYSVKETQFPDDYRPEGGESASDGGTITNRERTKTPETGVFGGHAVFILILLFAAEIMLFMILGSLRASKKI